MNFKEIIYFKKMIKIVSKTTTQNNIKNNKIYK
jgi:hypothetical protein